MIFLLPPYLQNLHIRDLYICKLTFQKIIHRLHQVFIVAEPHLCFIIVFDLFWVADHDQQRGEQYKDIHSNE